MRAGWAGTVLAGVVCWAGSVFALDHGGLLQDQVPAPQAPPPPDLFRLPPDLFTPPQPGTPPARPAPPLRRQAGPAACAHIRVIPANPSVDPRFIRPIPESALRSRGGNRAAPIPVCRYDEEAPTTPQR